MQTYHSTQQDDLSNNTEGQDSDWLNSDDENDEGKVDVRTKIDQVDHKNPSMIQRDTQKVERKLFDDGYREGIGLGKESAIQPGFDQGFSIGSPLGKRLGTILGSLNALELTLQPKYQHLLPQLISLKNRLNALKLSDLVEPDWEAIEHERTHGGQVDHIKRESAEEKLRREGILAGYEAELNDLINKITSL